MVLLFITLLLPFILSAADQQDAKPHHITITTGNESGKMPLHVARLSFFMRNYMQQPIFAQTNVISLDFQNQASRDAFDLELLISFVTQAEETLIAKPISSQGSYVQLADEEPLTSVNDAEKLLKLFIACDYLQFDFNQSPDFDDEAIKKAVTLKMVCLDKLQDKKKLFTDLDNIAIKYAYNFKACAWPYIEAQYHLAHTLLQSINLAYTTIFRDVLAHNKLKGWLNASHTNDTLYLHFINLISLRGIEDIDLTNLNKLFLNNNKLTHIPDLNCPELESLNLWDNQLSAIPACYLPNLKELNLSNNNIAVLPENLNNFPNLKWLDLRNNPITEIPKTLLRPGLAIHYGKR